MKARVGPIALLLMLGCATLTHSQDIYARYNGICMQGGQKVKTNGIQSHDYWQQSYPLCIVTVYDHGTSNLSTIFSDGAGTTPLANPFTASSTGVAAWYAANGTYDVIYSGSTIVVPFTIPAIILCFGCSGGGGGGSPALPSTAIQFNNGGFFGGSAAFTFDPATPAFVFNSLSTGTFNVHANTFQLDAATVGEVDHGTGGTLALGATNGLAGGNTYITDGAICLGGAELAGQTCPTSLFPGQNGTPIMQAYMGGPLHFISTGGSLAEAVVGYAGTTTPSPVLLPVADGTNGQCLQTDGNNPAQWSYGPCGGGGGGNVTTTPGTTAQQIAQGSSGGNTPGSDFGANSIGQVRYATQFQFTQSPSGTLAAGANTVTINAIRGISSWSAAPGHGSFSTQHYVRIAGTGTPEDVLLTATTCTGATTGTCTITFTAANSHSAGFTISSSTGGWQEAWDDCLVTPSAYAGFNPQSGCKVVGSSVPGNTNYLFTAPFDMDYPPGDPTPFIADGQSSIVSCATHGTSCFKIGATAAANHPIGVTLENFTIIPARAGALGRTADGTTRAIYDSGLGSVIYNNTIPAANSTTDYFDYAIYIDGDQKVTIEHNFANTGNGPGMKCDSTFCGSFIYGSTLNNGALGRIIDNDLTMECFGNAITWLSGNGVTIEGNVIQDWNQWGVLYGPGLQDMSDLGGNYWEAGASCVNPDIGQTGYGADAVAYWGNNKFTQPAGKDHGIGITVRFSNTGATQYAYYIVGINGSSQQSPPLYLGYANTNGSTPYTMYWPKFGATTYTVLRSGPLVNDGTETAPYGTGNWAVSTGITCSSNPCSFTENFGATSSIAIAPAYTPSFAQMPYWPNNIFMGHGTGVVPVLYEGGYQPCITANSIPTNGNLYQARFEVTVNGFAAGNCPSGIVASYPAPTTQAAITNGFTGAILTQISNGSNLTNSTGLYNSGLNAHGSESLQFQTYDADPNKTLATWGHQRALESGDQGIGFDASPTHFMTQCGANDCTWYVNHIADNSNFAARLSATTLTMKVPLTFSGTTFAFNSPEVSAPASPSAGTQSCYASAGNGLACKNAAGTVFTMTAAGAGTNYQTVQNAGTGLPPEPSLNFIITGGACVDNAGATRTDCTIPGAGTVTSFSAGALSPLFTTSVATSTTTPALTFSLTNAGGGTVFGRSTGTSGAPAYTINPVLGIAGTSTGTLGLTGATSGTVTVTPQAAAGSPTLTLPNASGTFAVSATSPIVLSATTGNLTGPTIVTATALTTQRIPVSSGAQALVDSCLTSNGTTVTNTCTGGLIAGPASASNMILSGVSTNTDAVGRLTLVAGAKTYTFAGTYATAPVCMFRDETTPANAVTTQTVSTTTITLAGTGTDVIAYMCMGLN